MSLEDLPLRTRSKVVKEQVCRALGYPIPRSFRRTQPRFPGQLFDTYVQKSNNLQIWNEEISASRRYVIVRVDAQDVIANVRVVSGDSLRLLDTTGTLTQKYQARLVTGESATELIVSGDTELLEPFVMPSLDLSRASSPSMHPQSGQLLPIAEVFTRLIPLVGVTFADSGYDQDRNRGAELHRLVCQYLGYRYYHDDGRYPDVRHQLLEVEVDPKIRTGG